MIRQPFESDDYAKACSLRETMSIIATHHKQDALKSGHVPTICYWTTVEEILADELLMLYLYPLIVEYCRETVKHHVRVASLSTQKIPAIQK